MLPHMTTDTETSTTALRKTGYWPGLAALVAATTAIGSSVLFLVGFTVLQTYYLEWGVDSALIAATPQQTIVLGYHALVNEYAAGFVKITGRYLLWIVAYALLLWLVALASDRWGSRGKGALSKLASQNPGLARLMGMLAASLGVVVVMPLMLGAMALLLLVWPLTAADDYGKGLAARQLADFKRGCDSKTSGNHCATLTRKDALVARGFLIGSSERVIALFDPASSRTIVVEREGLQLSNQPRGLPP